MPGRPADIDLAGDLDFCSGYATAPALGLDIGAGVLRQVWMCLFISPEGFAASSDARR